MQPFCACGMFEVGRVALTMPVVLVIFLGADPLPSNAIMAFL
jgi:hypothetical protein